MQQQNQGNLLENSRRFKELHECLFRRPEKILSWALSQIDTYINDQIMLLIPHRVRVTGVQNGGTIFDGWLYAPSDLIGKGVLSPSQVEGDPWLYYGHMEGFIPNGAGVKLFHDGRSHRGIFRGGQFIQGLIMEDEHVILEYINIRD